VALTEVLAEPRVDVDLPDHRWARMLTIIGAPVGALTGRTKIACTVGHLTSVPAVVAETNALAFVPRSLATHATFAPAVQVLDTPLALSPLKTFAYWHESADADPAHRWLRQALTERFWAPEPM
jgi:DNA-binding transcriptional LysR family regulator